MTLLGRQPICLRDTIGCRLVGYGYHCATDFGRNLGCNIKRNSQSLKSTWRKKCSCNGGNRKVADSRRVISCMNAGDVEARWTRNGRKSDVSGI